jgi:hypothetical protein
MSRLAFTLAVAFLPAPMHSQECGASLSAKQLANLTEMARRVIETGAYTGWDEKAFERAGDLGSIAIVRALPQDGSVNPVQMRSVLLLVRESFSCLDRCVQSSDDKEPRVTLLLLEHLREHGPPDTRSDVEEVQTFVLKQTEVARHAK